MRRADDPHAATAEQLAAYAAGTLSASARAGVAQHLAACARCQADLAAWQAVRDAARAALPAAVTPRRDLLAGVQARLEGGRAGAPGGPRHAALLALQLLGVQQRLLRRRLLAGCALVLALGLPVAASAANGMGGALLALLAPLAAAVGVALTCGPEADPAREVTMATPTAPRAVLLARFTVIVGYDMIFALAASVVMVLAGGAGPLPAVVAQWLGPLLLLAALSLVLSLWLGPPVAAGCALGLWAARVLAGALPPALTVTPFLEVIAFLWSTNLLTLGGSLLLGAAALARVPARPALGGAA